MNFIAENWHMIVLLALFAAWLIVMLIRTKDMSKDEIYDQIQGWLLQAVIFAEQTYGGGTGRLKLSEVYAEFCEAMPWLAKMVTFDEFSKHVDDALIEMRHLLDTNDAIAGIVDCIIATDLPEVDKGGGSYE